MSWCKVESSVTVSCCHALVSTTVDVTVAIKLEFRRLLEFPVKPPKTNLAQSEYSVME